MMRRRLLSILLLIITSGCSMQVAGSEPVTTPKLGITVTTVASIATKQVLPTATAEPQATLIPYETPAWFSNAVMYEVFVRSFYDSDDDGVGDLLGVAEKLDYIQSLGVDVIWLMPIYPSPSEHGYDVTDYYSVNPDYGSLDDLRFLVAQAHERGIRIILDFVPSHLSNQHPMFQDAYKNPDSIYSDWFVWTNETHTQYAGFAGNESMPRFNHYNSEVVDYLINAALFWLDLDDDGDYTDGVDGFRIDNATFPPHEFFMAFRQGIKAHNPDALLLGEAWLHKPSDMKWFFENEFDALFDFPFYEIFQGNQNFNGDGLLAGKGFPVLVTQLIQESMKTYPTDSYVVKFLNNHDTNRIATEVDKSPRRMKLAPALLAAMPGPVMLYYGEELGMPGQKGGPPYWDNYRREPMDWYAMQEGKGQPSWFVPPDRNNMPADGISVEEQLDNPQSLLSFYRHVFSMRKELPALSRGEFGFLDMEVSQPLIWGFSRTTEEQILIALYNFSNESGEAILPVDEFFPSDVIDVLTGKVYPFTIEGESYIIELEPESAVWLLFEK